MRRTLRKKRNNENKFSWVIYGILIVILLIILYYIVEIDRKWKTTPIKTQFSVSFNDTIRIQKKFLPLIIIIDNNEFLIDSSYTKFNLSLEPNNYKTILKGNNGQILDIDTFKFEGNEWIDYYLKRIEVLNDSLVVEGEFIEIFEL